MSTGDSEMVSVRIIRSTKDSPVGKLADAEVVFEAAAGPFSGLKLIGFGVWEQRNGGGRNVSFPARTYSVNGERRNFALLRPERDPSAQEAIRQCILDAYSRLELQADESSASAGTRQST